MSKPDRLTASHPEMDSHRQGLVAQTAVMKTHTGDLEDKGRLQCSLAG